MRMYVFPADQLISIRPYSDLALTDPSNDPGRSLPNTVRPSAPSHAGSLIICACIAVDTADAGANPVPSANTLNFQPLPVLSHSCMYGTWPGLVHPNSANVLFGPLNTRDAIAFVRVMGL